MLLRFGFANHFSVLDYVELSMTASAAIKDDSPDLIVEPGIKESILPVALVYGANASGKSTVHSALATMRGHVVHSFAKTRPSSLVPREAFGLSPRGKEEPSKFDCDFILNHVRFHYGFELTDKEFIREWLYSFPEGSRRTLYIRDGGEISFGKTLRGRNQAIKDFMRPNSLFLSVAAQNAHPQLSEVYEFFDKKLVVIGASVNSNDIEQSMREGFDSRIVEFLHFADTGIVDATVERKPHDEKSREMIKRLSEALQPMLESAGEEFPEIPDDRTSIAFLHASSEGEPISLPFGSESRGTIRLLALAKGALDAIDQGAVLLVDELDVSLHTLLALELVSLFSSRKTNPQGAQLIATTHDTNILCHRLLRRDQIWFCEKSKGGMSVLYPLTHIRTRNTDNLEKGYLQGRFGAVPFLGRLDELFAKEQLDG